ncbi:MAG TPA: FtsX-like permease family protein [Pirellulaceae bacterium]|nr:FtsX-like permease family protein [Pirellulaceae bacterium]
MYKLLLSWRYLHTRYIALASIISVTLGVATLIVVNSVMAGFTKEMHNRLHGILSDIVLESYGLDGFADPQWHMEQIRKICGDEIMGMTPVIHVPALLRIPFRGDFHTRQINLIGVDKTTYADVSDFSQYLLHPENRQRLSFLLREAGYAPGRKDFPPSGWEHRRMQATYEKALEQQRREMAAAQNTGRAATADNAPPADPYASSVPTDPYSGGGATEDAGAVFDPATEQNTGIVLGIATCSIRGRDATGEVRDFYVCRPGDDVQVYFPNAGSSPKAVSCSLTVVDFYESKMSEYDATFAFMPIEKLQELRGMFDPLTNTTYVTSIQMKLRPGADLNAVRDKLRAAFPPDQYPYRIETWRDLQGPLLAAVHMETTILNILLFLIIAVAGFGILATFFMIVVEKTRDIGILKALGAPSRGVMSIFLSYGVSLGAVGSGVGLVLGLLFVTNINAIAKGLEWITGREVFDPTVYYFQEIPTSIQPTMVVGVMVGSVLIAVLASVLPAIRAARLHPVAALRYE